MKYYQSLFTRHKEQDASTAFAYFPFNPEEPWEGRLAKLAQEEDWSFSTDEFRNKYKTRFPILINYLNFSFLRTQEQGLITYSEEKDKACFNTGLITREEKDIYVTFFKNKPLGEKPVSDWTFYSFAESYSDKLKPFPQLPPAPEFISDPAELIYDYRLPLEVNYEHIIEKCIDRFPAVFHNNPRLALTSVKGEVDLLRTRIRRNYKLAIPHWFEGKLQMLLPLHLTSDQKADIALVVQKDRERGMYKGSTVLTLDMAYIDARLVAKPDREWLNP